MFNDERVFLEEISPWRYVWENGMIGGVLGARESVMKIR